MSNFMETTRCRVCKKNTRHNFMDDTPRRRHYTIKCDVCGYVSFRDIPDFAIKGLVDYLKKVAKKEKT